MEYYNNVMGGLEGIFNALLEQQSQPQTVEVDEMGRPQQSLADAIQEASRANHDFGIDPAAQFGFPTRKKDKGFYGPPV